jgi:hypothetical protein
MLIQYIRICPSTSVGRLPHPPPEDALCNGDKGATCHREMFDTDTKEANFVCFFVCLYVVYLTNPATQELSYLSQYCGLLQTRRPGFDPRQRQRILPLTSVPRSGLRPTQPPIQWVPVFLSPGVKRGLTLTTHPHLKTKNEYELYLLSSLSSAWR